MFNDDAEHALNCVFLLDRHSAGIFFSTGHHLRRGKGFLRNDNMGGETQPSHARAGEIEAFRSFTTRSTK
jgi:hypothetical protein